MAPGLTEATAADLAAAALELARHYAAGATMWCLAPEWPEHGRHVAVEFVHPVVIGKRALPAVAATVLALDRAPAGGVYDIVDDRAVSLTQIVEALAEYTGSAPPRRVPGWLPKLIAPYMARVTAIRMPLSNAKATAELGWRPRYPTMRDGLARMFPRAA